MCTTYYMYLPWYYNMLDRVQVYVITSCVTTRKLCWNLGFYRIAFVDWLIYDLLCENEFVAEVMSFKQIIHHSDVSKL